MALHLAWLLARLRAAGVGIAVSAGWPTCRPPLAGVDAVVNCTGLGARELAGDRTLSPVRGQIVVVEQFGLTEWLLDQDDPERLTYLVPRGDTVILGGTAEEGDAEPRGPARHRRGDPGPVRGAGAARRPAPGSSATGWGCGRPGRRSGWRPSCGRTGRWCTATATAAPG